LKHFCRARKTGDMTNNNYRNKILIQKNRAKTGSV
jgi:hypothetical protein